MKLIIASNIYYANCNSSKILRYFFAVIVISFIILFLLRDGYRVLGQVSLPVFLLGTTWAPTAVTPLNRILPLIVGTILVTIGAMVFAVPLSIGCAIFISELAAPRLKTVLKPAIELLPGISSVVYGFFGLIVLTNFIRVTFNIPTGNTWLAASVLLGIMALPTIVSVSEDAISAVPREFREGSLAIGATRWQTISRVIVRLFSRYRCVDHSRYRQGDRGDHGGPDGSREFGNYSGADLEHPHPRENPDRDPGDRDGGSLHRQRSLPCIVCGGSGLLIITLVINLSAVAILRYLHEGRMTRSRPETSHQLRYHGRIG